MHIYRLCLIFLHVTSAVCYFPHLIVLITHRAFHLNPLKTQIAYVTYWMNYTVLVLAALLWSLIVVCRQATSWQVIQVSGYFLIGKFIYVALDVITRILLKYHLFVIVFDFIHLMTLAIGIVMTFFLVKDVQRKRSISNKSRSFIDQS